MARIYRASLLIAITVALLCMPKGDLRAAIDTSELYLGNMLAYKAVGVEITSTQVTVKVTGGSALITWDYQLVNRGAGQTVTAAYPSSKWQEADLITGFAASKNNQPLPVKKRRQLSITGWTPIEETMTFNVFSFPLAEGETCTIRNSYFATLPTDAMLGRLLHFNNRQPGGWTDTGLKKIDISIVDFKPYYNVMLFPGMGLPPQKYDYNGNFSYLVDPQANRSDIYLYYQLRGYEAALQRLTMSAYGQPLLQLIQNGNYSQATEHLQLLSSTLTAEGVLSSTDLTHLKVYLAYQQKNYQLAAEELNRLTIKDGAYEYYQILNSLQLNQQAAAGQSFQEIGQFAQQDLTGTSTGLLKAWAEKNISQYLARPAAPVPNTTTKPKQHTAVMLITLGLVLASSIAITVLMRRNH